MTRPETLFPLFASLQTLAGVGPKSSQLFEKIGIHSPRDMLFALPVSGVDRRPTEDLSTVQFPAVVTILIRILAHIPAQRKGGVYRIQAEANGLPVQVVYFRPVGGDLVRRLEVGREFWVSGRAERANKGLSIAHPDYIEPETQGAKIPSFDFSYPATAGLGQKVLRQAAAQSVARVPKVDEWIDSGLLHERGWPDWNAAIGTAHSPQNIADLDLSTKHRSRLAYDEVLAHQLTLALARKNRRARPGRATQSSGNLRRVVETQLPFSMTTGQQACLGDILGDLASPQRMMRLLQGDVGSGKTLVALMAMLEVVDCGGQAALMAPTEILARQHFETIREYLGPINVSVAVMTGRDTGRARAEIVAAIASGDFQIVIGTQSLIQKTVNFHDLRLAVVDEQHRFGVRERQGLSEKGAAVDVLVMTATPIPRSLALTQYGDMEVSILREKPPGRRAIQTAVVSLERIDQVVGRLRAAIADGQQAYWVCPLVEESELSDLAAAQQRFEQLRRELGDDCVVLVHGRMTGPEKDAAMRQFQDNDRQVLVATTVIEVGVNVPSATIMVIERAENFGLSQLHQLRGRVGRGAQASTCVLMYQPPLTSAGEKRLKTLRDSEDGFHLAEVDLQMRGAGDVLGLAQSGLPRFRIADLESQSDLMDLARKDADLLIAKDPDLTSVRGQAARLLLWLMRYDEAIQRLHVG